MSFSHPRKSPNNREKRQSSFLPPDPRSGRTLPGTVGNHQQLQKLPWGFPIFKTFFSSCRLGVLQGVFQSQGMVWDAHWVPSVGTQCGCQVQVVRPFSDRVTNNFLGFSSEMLSPSFYSFSCSSYTAYGWSTTFCCISSGNIEILFQGLEKKHVIQKNMAMKWSVEKQCLYSSNELTGKSVVI